MWLEASRARIDERSRKKRGRGRVGWDRVTTMADCGGGALHYARIRRKEGLAEREEQENK